MKIKITLTLITAIIAINAATSVNLHFYDSVSVSQKDIYLKDVARVNASEELKNRLENTVIGEAAPAGYSRFVTSESTVLYDLSRKYSYITFNLAGAARCKVSTNGKINLLYEFEELIEEYVSKNVKWKGTDWRIEIQNGEKKIRTFPGKYNVTIAGKIDSDDRGMIPLLLHINQNGDVKKVAFTCKLIVSVPVVKTGSFITRGETLKESDLYIERSDITSLRYMPIIDMQKAIGAIASRSISKGSIIHDLCVKKTPEVRKGDMVYIEMSSGSVRISLPARAREDGYKGETIWVENIKSHKVIRVKVKDNGKVSLMEGELI